MAHQRLFAIEATSCRKGDLLDNGRYEVKKLLGFGTHGKVYEAFDRELQESVSIKITNDLEDGEYEEAKNEMLFF